MRISTIGIDLAKNIFQVHAETTGGEVVFNRALRRSQVLAFFERLEPCLVGMEACATSHYWAREISKLGHDVRLMPPTYVKPSVKRGKSDAGDAAAICEAVTRPTMRFVAIKTVEQQGLLSQHRARQVLIGQRTQLANLIRSLIGEFGCTVRRGVNHVTSFAVDVRDGNLASLPESVRTTIAVLCEQFLDLQEKISELEKMIFAASRKDERVRLLQTIPGVGPITASAVVATIGEPERFKSGRDFAAWIGLTPLNKSSGGKERLGRITKMGDKYLRRLLVAGMTARIGYARRRPDSVDPWIINMLGRKPARLATIAMANKTARIIWAVLTRNEPYQAPQAKAA
jgi:transposase